MIPASLNAPVQFTVVPHETIPDRWTVVTNSGERTIVLEHGQFKALHCGRLPSTVFQDAVKACIDDIEWQAFLIAEAAAKYRAFVDSINRATDAEIDAVMAARKLETELLRYSDADSASDRMAANARLEDAT